MKDKPGLLKMCLAVEDAYHLHDRCASASRDSVARSTVFPCVDDLLLGEMFRAYAEGHLRVDDAQALINQRRDKPWFTMVKVYYDAPPMKRGNNTPKSCIRWIRPIAISLPITMRY